jgi:hypothetical protein
MSEDLHSRLLRAARWAETANEPEIGYQLTAPILYRLAAEYVAGSLDLSKLPEAYENEGTWSGIVARLHSIGIDVVDMAFAKVPS